MPSRYSHDEEEEAAESQALILQRLKTGPQPSPRPHTSSSPFPSTSSSHRLRDRRDNAYEDDDEGSLDDDLEEQTDELLEKRRLRALAKQRAKEAEDDPVNHVGRPPWLVNTIERIQRLSLIKKLALAAASLLALAGIFYLAIGPTGDGSGLSKATWNWGGNLWKGGKMPYDFPSDIGYPGPMQKGPPAELAQEDTVSESGHAKKPWNALPVEITLAESKAKYGDFEPFLHMGPLTPYAPSPGFGIDDGKYRRVPRGCSIEQVHYLSRHGSRYPTSGSPANLIHDLLKQSPRPVFTGPLAFMNTYEYRLGKELLVPLGRQQLYDEGVSAVISYGKLIYSDISSFGSIFARAGSQHRIVESAKNWLAGALGVGGQWKSSSTLEIQIEADGFNTTLAPNFACPNAGRAGWDVGIGWKNEWIDDYAKAAVDRLQPHVQGLTLTPKLINALQQVCSYDTVAGFDATALCSLFTKDEWLGYEYAWDLEFYGGYASGSSVGPAQGIGWVNELLARLTGEPWDASTQTSENSTFNSHPRTFPVDRAFYVDFTHDSVIANVLAALDLPGFSREMPIHRPDPNRLYRTSQLVPFGARLVVEKLHCPTNSNSASSTSSSSSSSSSSSGGSSSSTAAADLTDRYIRMFLNDALLPLASLSACAVEKRQDAVCSLHAFLRSLQGRMERVKWERCFEK